MAKFKRLILTELGNTTDTYEWKNKTSLPSMWKYQFNADGTNYTVRFDPHILDEYLEVSFYPARGEFDTDIRRQMIVTNEGKQYKITATVIEIARHAWKNRQGFDNSENLKGFVIYPTKQKSRKTNVRKRLYKRFIKSKFPSAEIVSGSQNEIKVNVQSGKI